VESTDSQIFVPKSLHQAMKHFANPEVAQSFVVNLRWPDGVTCPYCQGKDHSYISTRRVWACKGCAKRFSVRVGTVLEDSRLPLETWLAGMFLIANAKNGISSCEVGRALGITQKTAWFLMHRIRLVLKTGSIEKLSGVVEADETLLGGLEKWKHVKNRLNVGGGYRGKMIVLGFVQRDGDVRTVQVPDVQKVTILPEIRSNIEAGSTLYTDTWPGYKKLQGEYVHGTVNHHYGNYVNGDCTTNRIEGYWAMLKRTIRGSYISISSTHLHRYLAEQEFRYNLRKVTDGERFLTAAACVTGKHLTYKELIGKK
jgi:transposase-like protein